MSELTTQEKSLALAELMGWEVQGHAIKLIWSEPERCSVELCPYTNYIAGLAQFAAILLKYQEAAFETSGLLSNPTQADYLDTVLRMEGKL